jgi:sugar phosphate isomerase/epimerase
MTQPNRPLLISIVQYMDELDAGRVTIFDIIEAARQLGAAGVELRREAWPKMAEELAAARSRLQDLDLIVTYATFATLFSAEAEAEAILYQDIDTAAALGASLFRVFQGPAPADHDAAGWAKGQAVIDYAANRQVTIALENYARSPGGRLAEITRTLDRLPALTTNIDFANYAGHGQDIFEAIAAVGRRASYAHLKDISESGDLTALGDGTLPVAEIMAALDALPQPMLYCFEFRGGGDPARRIKKSLDFLGQERKVAR